jgi:type VI protein secretion system component VasK
MFARIFNRCWLAVTASFLMVIPLWAQAQDAAAESETQEWVLSYAVMIAFLALIMLILLRPTKRDDSAFSFDEQQALREEEMKKIKGGH